MSVLQPHAASSIAAPIPIATLLACVTRIRPPSKAARDVSGEDAKGDPVLPGNREIAAPRASVRALRREPEPDPYREADGHDAEANRRDRGVARNGVDVRLR